VVGAKRKSAMTETSPLAVGEGTETGSKKGKKEVWGGGKKRKESQRDRKSVLRFPAKKGGQCPGWTEKKTEGKKKSKKING